MQLYENWLALNKYISLHELFKIRIIFTTFIITNIFQNLQSTEYVNK